MTRARVSLIQLAVAVLCVLFLHHEWPTTRDFVLAIDHGDVLFADFVFHYYPTLGALREGAPAGGFFYPAGFAALLAPLGFLSLEMARVAWGLVLVICVAIIAGPLVRIAARGNVVLSAVGTAITVTSIPVLHDLKWGQVSVPLVAIVGSAFVLRATREWTAAVLLAIAAAIKGYPLMFIGWFVLRLDLKFTLRTAAACVVTLVVLPAILLGPAHALFFQEVSTNAMLGAAAGVLRDFNSQYAPAVYARYHGGWDLMAVDTRAIAELGSFATLAGIALLVIVVARSSSPRIAERRELLGFVLVASTVPFWLHTSWSHYFAHLPVAQVLLASIFVERRSPRDLASLVVFVVPSIFISNVLQLLMIKNDPWLTYAWDGSLFFANALVLLGCTSFIVEAHLREGGPLVTARWPFVTAEGRPSQISGVSHEGG